MTCVSETGNEESDALGISVGVKRPGWGESVKIPAIMSMLSEPRRRQKWTLNPRGNLWAQGQ
eukprot:maker-scaffold217_size252476-snap-gene-0.15 protein:Tk00453 transcript:maker-scaffold217_size252476-snap-gene-0.15-mRNA-1 annotation:"hypothetical protein DICPUDRAFT_27726"